MFTAKDSRLHRNLKGGREIKFPYQFQKKESFSILVILINCQKSKAHKKVIALWDSVLAKCCKKALNSKWPYVLLKPKLLLRKHLLQPSIYTEVSVSHCKTENFPQIYRSSFFVMRQILETTI